MHAARAAKNKIKIKIVDWDVSKSAHARSACSHTMEKTLIILKPLGSKSAHARSACSRSEEEGEEVPLF